MKLSVYKIYTNPDSKWNWQFFNSKAEIYIYSFHNYASSYAAKKAALNFAKKHNIKIERAQTLTTTEDRNNDGNN